MALAEVMSFTRIHFQGMYYFIKRKAAQSIGAAMGWGAGTDMPSSLDLISKRCLMVLLFERCVLKPTSALMCVNPAPGNSACLGMENMDLVSFLSKLCWDTGSQWLPVIVNTCHIGSYWLTCKSLAAEIQAMSITVSMTVTPRFALIKL